MRRAGLPAEPDGSSDRTVAHLRTEGEGKTSGEASCRKVRYSLFASRYSLFARTAAFVTDALCEEREE
jgi:hypothetical protein